ncbi:unnamed protein product [Ilex paraguariensis]|uniref:Omega-hydroxypalmitate O-feruloyl transferase n=1 Tax=Ilex paraguariensis TaxID=185542 RepID=A0ABC8RUL7_9AQUA
MRIANLPHSSLQITNLRCGGMILCTAINHCLCDGIGTSQFLNAWAHLTTKPGSNLPINPFHSRHVLKPRKPPQTTTTHTEFTKTVPDKYSPQSDLTLNQYLQSQPLVPTSLIFTPSQILHLKRQCVPSLKCTTFEVLASHTWRSWVKSLDLSPSFNVKLLFSVNVRRRLKTEMPQGYYGNGFVLGCAEATVKDLVAANLRSGVKLVQEAKASLTDDYVKSVIDLLEDKTVKTDISSSLVISQWSKLGLEDLDFGEGKPLHMGPLTSDIYCLFLPVIGDFHAVRVLVSLPESVVNKFEYYMKEFLDSGEDKGDANGYRGEENDLTLNQYLQSQPLVPTSLIFTPSQILHLKRQCVPSLKCTTFEVLASHTWRSWVKSLDLSPSFNVKLLFSVNVRRRLKTEMPQGYYGNGFVLGCAEATVKDLVAANLRSGVKLVQEAKASLTDDYVKSVIDLLEDKTVKTDISSSLVISQWSKLGLEDLDFGEGKPLHMGPLTSDIYCLFLPVIGDFHAVRVLVSLPESVVNKFEYYMKEFLDSGEDKGDANGYRGEENGII